MKRQTLHPIIFLTAIALVLRLYRIGSQNLWVDEILTLTVSDPKPGLNIWDYLKYNIHGPLHAFVVYIFHLFSTNAAWLRIPSAVAGAFSVYYLYRWIEVWLGSRVAHYAAVLLLFSPLHLYYSQELRNYSLLFFFATFSSYQLHRLLLEESRGRFVAYTAGMIGAALCNFSAAFLYIVHTVLYLGRRGPAKQRLARWVMVSVMIFVLISPWVYRIYTFVDVQALVTPVMPGQVEDIDRLRGGTTVTLGAVPYMFYTFSVGFTLGPSLRELHHDATMAGVLRANLLAVLWVTVLFAAAAVRGVVVIARGRRRQLVEVLLYLLVPVVLTLLLSWQNAKAFNVRYVFLGLPAYLSVLAVALSTLRAPLKWYATTALVGTLVVSMGNLYFNTRYARADVRAAAQHVSERIVSSECVLAPTVAEVFEHYFDKDNHVYRVFEPVTSAKQNNAQLEKVFANCTELWYVRAREWEFDPQGHLLDMVNQRYRQTERAEFNGVVVLRYASRVSDKGP